ncbi:glycosyltransferase [Luteimonas sp. FCS-9]|uniref:glycosyltransferase n=1 Tax=Luteimonas sp. FCS-9 TaxID=1547516 RepID=UPI00063EAD1D|nr:glycosyltransferase [Luteimonas sp. FCS-9]KLJ00752.1 hypothetical protein WQ56_08125 [Luteimonas sp. FCS-9]
MIFVTIGTQLPFDRLIEAVDQAIARTGISGFAQIGPGSYIPSNVRHERFVDADRFEELVSHASCIVSHAGMGSIISAMRYAKPAILMPRMAALGEHRNDHQLATARRFRDHALIRIANDADEIIAAYREIQGMRIAPGAAVSAGATPELVSAIRSMVFGVD